VSSHAVSVITLGIPSGLVIDCGYAETVVLPVNIFLTVLQLYKMWLLTRFCITFYCFFFLFVNFTSLCMYDADKGKKIGQE